MTLIDVRRRLRGPTARDLRLSALVFLLTVAIGAHYLWRPQVDAVARLETGPTATAEAAASANDFVGVPTRITDGDTIRLGETRIRFFGIDAPEMSTPEGEPARQHLIALIGPGSVRCDDTGSRSYARIVAICYDASGHDLSAAMVHDGWAEDWPRYSHGRYAAAEVSAMAANRGMYGG